MAIEAGRKNDQLPPATGWEFRALRWAKMVGVAEAVWGLCFTAMFCLLGITIGSAFYLFPVDRQGHFYGHYWVLRIAAWLVVFWCGFRSVAICSRSISWAMVPDTSPAPVLTANRLLSTPFVARPVLAIWWLGLAVGTLLLSRLLYAELSNMPSVQQSLVGRGIIYVAIEFSGAVAANTSLLVALAAATGSGRIVRTAYRFRLLFDAGLTALFYFVDVEAIFR